MNKVKVLFFATLRDYTGLKSVELKIPSGITVGEMTGILMEKYPRLEKVKECMMIAINREYADNKQVVPERAEIAFFPPVSGG